MSRNRRDIPCQHDPPQTLTAPTKCACSDAERRKARTSASPHVAEIWADQECKNAALPDLYGLPTLLIAPRYADGRPRHVWRPLLPRAAQGRSAPPPASPPDRHRRLHPSPESFPGNRLQPGGRPQEPNRDGKSRTPVLTATMRSPTIGSPDQTQKRAHCAKKHRPRRATAPDFPACAGVPEGDQETQNFVS